MDLWPWKSAQNFEANQRQVIFRFVCLRFVSIMSMYGRVASIHLEKTRQTSKVIYQKKLFTADGLNTEHTNIDINVGKYESKIFLLSQKTTIEK